MVPQFTYPLTGAGCVNRVYTDVATFDITTEGVKVTATYGVTFDELAGMLDIALIDATA